MWYFYQNNQQAGPVDQRAIESLISATVLTGDTPVWTEGMPDWVPVKDSPLAPFLRMASLSSSLPATDPQKGSPGKLWFVYALCAPSFAVLAILGIFLNFQGYLKIGNYMTLTGLALGVIGTIVYGAMVFRAWELAQVINPPISTKAAVGFSFLPIFNLYWGFLAFYGLAVFVNEHLQSHGSTVRAKVHLIFISCILWCISAYFPLLPYTILPAIICSVLGWRSLHLALSSIAATGSDPAGYASEPNDYPQRRIIISAIGMGIVSLIFSLNPYLEIFAIAFSIIGYKRSIQAKNESIYSKAGLTALTLNIAGLILSLGLPIFIGAKEAFG